MEYISPTDPQLALDEKELESPQKERYSAFEYLEATGGRNVEVKESGADEGEGDEYYPEGGRGWGVVLGCFLLCSTTLNWPLAFGVFQDYYKREILPDVDVTVLSLLGSTQGAIMPIVSFICGKLEDRYGYRNFVYAGCVFGFLTIFGTAWGTKLWHFFLTQGILQGVTGGILFPLLVAYPAQWFKRRRGLAIGIVISGSSIGGGMASLVIRAMLTPLGLRKTLIIYSGIQVVFFILALFLIKGRDPKVRRAVLPSSAASYRPVRTITWVDRSYFGDLVFWSLTVSLLIAVFGYLPPYFFMPTYTREKVINLGSEQLITLPIVVMNFSAALGRILVGYTADRVGPANTYILAVCASGLTQLAVWNFATTYPTILVFGILYGFFGGCLVSLLGPVGAQLFGQEQLANLSGLLILSNLPGYIAGPTLAGVVLQSSNHNWHIVTLYSGGVQLFGAAVFLYARFKRQPRLFVVF